MRSFSKLHGCAASVILLLVYFSYHQRSIGIASTSHGSWQGTRLVVFGDEWSDIGTRHVSTPSLSSVADHGEMWTETLCKELACDRIDNFARSLPTVSDNATTGASVDVGTHSSTATADSPDQTEIDFKTQVQQFLEFDKAMRVPQSLRIPHGQTIFTVYFGLWDLLEYSKLELKLAMERIDKSITAIFLHLDLLATPALSPMQVVLPRMVDITYLPRYQSMANQTGERYAELQQKGIFLVAYWNAVLIRSASRWENGAIFMPDPSDVVLELLRVEQLPSHRDTDAPGAVKHMPLSKHVDQLCLITLSDGSTIELNAVDVDECSKAVIHLFRDDLHLGAVTHRLIGKQAAKLVHDTTTINRVSASEGSFSEYIPEGPDLGRFDLKYPPGY